VAAVAAVVGWYVFALLILHPLTDAPVVDSWLYGSSVRRFLRTGEIRFAGYTQAMPIAQVVYGVAWARIFGGNSASLEISVVVLAILCGLMFHALAIRCGAPRWQALAATGLLICNPCFTFLSFSFMTEIPFLTAMIATHLAFARALGRREQLWLWLSAAAAVVGFLIRPFAAMAIAGCVGATLLYDGDLRANFRDRAQWLNPRLIKLIAPFAAALAICVGLWVWLTVLGPKPWQVQFNENRFNYIFMVPLANYLRAGVLGPVLYLGTVLSPLALLQLATPRWRRVAIGGVGIFVAALILMWIDDRLPVTPEYSCFGGWQNVLILRGAANRFSWAGEWQYVFLLLASFGAAGLVAAFSDILRTLDRGAAAIVIAALIYWAATIPLWFYNDRYYLVMVPAGAIVLALARAIRRICDDARDGPDVARRYLRLSARDGGDRRHAQRPRAPGSSTHGDRRRLCAQRRGSLSLSQARNRHGEARRRNSDDHIAERRRLHDCERAAGRDGSRATTEMAGTVRPGPSVLLPGEEADND
jgi:hypothetical protein